MIKYKDWSPTPFDTKGLNMEEHQEWYVVAIKTRDSGCLERANFDAIKRDNPDCEIGNFGHWACGWLEVLLIESEEKAAEIEEALNDYPVYDENLFSEYELEYSEQCWEPAYMLRDLGIDEEDCVDNWEEVLRDNSEWEGDSWKFRGDADALIRTVSIQDLFDKAREHAKDGTPLVHFDDISFERKVKDIVKEVSDFGECVIYTEMCVYATILEEGRESMIVLKRNPA